LAEPTFDRAIFAARLRAKRLGRTLIVRAEAGSTNDVAWEALATQPVDGITVIADAQTELSAVLAQVTAMTRRLLRQSKIDVPL